MSFTVSATLVELPVACTWSLKRDKDHDKDEDVGNEIIDIAVETLDKKGLSVFSRCILTVIWSSHDVWKSLRLIVYSDSIFNIIGWCHNSTYHQNSV